MAELTGRELVASRCAKFFKDGDSQRNTLTEFNSNNTRILTIEETKETISKLAYIQERLAED